MEVSPGHITPSSVYMPTDHPALKPSYDPLIPAVLDTPEIIDIMFRYVPFEQNAGTNTLVCQRWRGVAGLVARRQMVTDFERKIEESAYYCLQQVVPLKLKDLCPIYAAKLEALKKSNCFFQFEGKFHRTLKDLRCSLVGKLIDEQFNVCIAGFFRINPTNIPADPLIRSALANRVFVQLHERYMFGNAGMFKLNNPHRYYFPMELFNLTIDPNTWRVVGKKNKGFIAFPLQGKLIALKLFEDEALRQEQFGLYEDLDMDNPPEVWLNRDNTDHLQSDRCFIPQFDCPIPANMIITINPILIDALVGL